MAGSHPAWMMCWTLVGDVRRDLARRSAGTLCLEKMDHSLLSASCDLPFLNTQSFSSLARTPPVGWPASGEPWTRLGWCSAGWSRAGATSKPPAAPSEAAEEAD